MTFALGPRAISAGQALHAYDTVGSTNAEALALAREGRGPAWVVARAQTAGRGRRGRAWSTGRGNLAASFGATLGVPAQTAATLGFVAGLALEQALRAVAPSLGSPTTRPELKWPNDVIVDGAKLAGILLEADTSAPGRVAIAVGIGVNVASAPEGLPYPAASLTARGDDTTAEQLFVALTDAFATWFDTWDDGRGFAQVRKGWMARAAGLGSTVTVDLGARIARGVFEKIDDDGRLVLRGADGTLVTVSAGEVCFGTAATVRE
ncbi:BirA family biotin operon repressor/biotin-[acetyl-CoA-carboxylase] ligase [Methylopila capsulata]|uniref:biotin--[biotin carboxyl-carrier protein] ligase n=1 Tax=Methylopila capsulata TaxID=61654 RepID=A0A9W6MSH1_9HYPH|nr:biotin--[acetyl-CoA-carboxylase] ligase [Methylopila capsulata]MBM7852029.1 BirA family biotin operon repressor/biotin-[acetyl-CoA-carboxylase] ligase [Methylopila capsulata]GLK56234.1 biotin--[acetyl-CoA-carboxylase] ligase [Methylopila capsulata]